MQEKDCLFVAGGFEFIFRDNNSERCFFNDVDLFLQRKKAFLVFVDHEFAQNKDSGAGADSLETLKADKDGFMEAKDEEIPFD